MKKEEAVECAEKLKTFCVERFDHGICEDCPFYNESTQTKCLIAPQNADPFEWQIKRRDDND